MYIVYSLELWAVKRNELLKKKFVLLTNFTNISSQLNYNNPDPLLKNILPHVLQPCIGALSIEFTSLEYDKPYDAIGSRGLQYYW